MVPEVAYKKIARSIKEEIIKGRYRPGDRIPSENNLASTFGVSRMTARKAVDSLVYEGVVIRIPGLGTYVAEGAKHIGNKNLRVGILIDDLADTRGIALLAGLTRTLLEFSVHPIMLEMEEYTFESIEKKIKRLLTYGVDGLIFPPKVDLSQSKFFTRLIDENFPIVFIDRGLEDLSVPVVESNNYQGAYCLGKHLKEKHNVKNVLFLSEEDLIISSVRERFEGIRDGIGRDIDFLQFSNLEYALLEVVRGIKAKRYDTIAFCHDILAAAGVSFFYKHGIKVPEDVKVTGFDDRRVAQFFYPSITTVRQNFDKMASTAALFIIKLLKGDRVPQREKIPVKLIIRKSCGCK